MKRTDYIGWDEYFMGIAMFSAQRSKDNNTQVGACIVNDERKITNHYHTAESVKQGRKEQGFVSYADTGWAGP